VVGVEDRVEGGEGDVAHVPAHPDVNVIVVLLELVGEVEESRQVEEVLDLLGRGERGSAVGSRRCPSCRPSRL
jgi:hypothetical protein